MLQYLIMCKSLTYAQRAARVLELAGITAIVTKAPQGVTNEGCGYCVKISERWLTNALQTLKNAGFAPGKIYLFGPDGAVQEVER